MEVIRKLEVGNYIRTIRVGEGCFCNLTWVGGVGEGYFGKVSLLIDE